MGARDLVISEGEYTLQLFNINKSWFFINYPTKDLVHCIVMKSMPFMLKTFELHNIDCNSELIRINSHNCLLVVDSPYFVE